MRTEPRKTKIFLTLKKIVDRQNAATMIRDPNAANRKVDAFPGNAPA